MEHFQFLRPNWTKNDTYQAFIKKYCHFRNQRMSIAHCANFHWIWSIFNFWDQIGPKMTPVRFPPKNIVTIVISVLFDFLVAVDGLKIANFHQIWSIFNFWDQNGPKMTRVRFLPKNIFTIVISVFQLPIVPIFIRFGAFSIFGTKLDQKWHL